MILHTHLYQFYGIAVKMIQTCIQLMPRDLIKCLEKFSIIARANFIVIAAQKRAWIKRKSQYLPLHCCTENNGLFIER
jgi:hypothetical protein